MRSDYRRVALIGQKTSWNKASLNRESAILLLLAAFLCFAATLIVSSIFFAETTKDNLYLTYEREVGDNVSWFLSEQEIQNGLIEDLALSLIEIENNQTSMLTFADANFTEIRSCGVRYGSSCSIPSRTSSQNYADYESFRNGTIRFSQLDSMNAHFLIAEIGNFSVPLVFESGSVCDLLISIDVECYANTVPVPTIFPGIESRTYRPNPIVFNCTGYPGCVNPKNVRLLGITTFSLVRNTFLYGNVITNPPPLLSVNIENIKMLISTSFI